MKITIFVAILMLIPISMAFADNSKVTIETAPKSGAPGCEETARGCYYPSTANVDVGGKVIFLNTDSAAHTFTSGTPRDGPDGIFDSSLAGAGSSFEFSPEASGEYPYFCMVHPWMTGLIIAGDGNSPRSGYVPFVPPKPTQQESSDNVLKNENIRLQNQILFLEKDNTDLIKDNFNLKADYKKILNKNKQLESKIYYLQDIINEQIKVILETLKSLKSN